jgi:hypothetical protein
MKARAVIKNLTLFVLLTLLAGCQSVSDTPAQKILGTWQSEVGGFPIEHLYDKNTISLSGHDAVAYQLAEDSLLVDSIGASNRIVSFPSEAEIWQTEPLTGSVHRFTR